jgi:hypothetical protein
LGPIKKIVLPLYLPGSYPDCFFHWHNEDLSITDFPGSRSFCDSCDQVIKMFISYHDLNLDLWQHIYCHCFSAVLQGNPLLFTPSSHLTNRHSGKSFLFKSFFHKFKSLWFYDRFYHFHRDHSSGAFTMLGDVEPDIFFFFSNPQSNSFVNNRGQYVSHDECIDQRRKCTDCICDELMNIAFDQA